MPATLVSPPPASEPPLFLFYEEPDPDRWFRGDHYPRKLIRRLVRGPARPGGVMRWFLNLKAGLDRLGVPYRVNDYRGLRRTPGAWAHVVGKQHVVDQIPAGHPIIYGPGIADHPGVCDFLGRADVRLIVAPCAWFKAMYDRDLTMPVPTAQWPAGIDTDRWRPPAVTASPREILIYDKIRWHREHYEPALIEPIRRQLAAAGCQVHYLRYGAYREEDYQSLLPRVGGMIFLCEHETQGFAYLQALSSGVPLLAWDRGGPWQDPNFYPDKVVYGPVSAVPYFDGRCGERFADAEEFSARLPGYLDGLARGAYAPRRYIEENFTLATRAAEFLEISRRARAGAPPSATGA